MKRGEHLCSPLLFFTGSGCDACYLISGFFNLFYSLHTPRVGGPQHGMHVDLRILDLPGQISRAQSTAYLLDENTIEAGIVLDEGGLGIPDPIALENNPTGLHMRGQRIVDTIPQLEGIMLRREQVGSLGGSNSCRDSQVYRKYRWR